MKLGIIGTGHISHRLAEAVSLTPGVTLWSVYSRDMSRGQAFAARYGVPTVHTDLAAFLADPQPDAVYVASPNSLHESQTVAALTAGKHVLCEKPLTTDRPACERMIACAKAHGRVLLEAMRPVHDPFYDLLQAHLPRVGRLRQVRLEYCQYSSRYDGFLRGEPTNAFTPALGNAALMDIGVYPVELCVYLFGLPRQVCSTTLRLPCAPKSAGAPESAGAFEGAGSALLSYGEMYASLTWSKITDSVTPSCLLGEAGALVIDKLSVPTTLTFYPRGGEGTVIPYTPAPNNMVHELRVFCELVAQGRVSHRFLSASAHTLQVLDTIRAQNDIMIT
ncbi:MAG: Gfo/Idh/MocA family oxidoreductase [Eubacteriales bacterium]